MGRFLATVVPILFAIVLAYGSVWLMRNRTIRRRQKLAAKFAPELLRGVEELPADFVEAYIFQRQLVDEAQTIFTDILNDEVVQMTLPTEYVQPINSWLRQRKEVSS